MRPSTLTAVVPDGRGSPSARVRVFEWLDRVDPFADVIPFWNGGQKLLGLAQGQLRLSRLPARSMDCVLLHREASPIGFGGLERNILDAARYSVYDFDDALMWDFRRLTKLVGPKFLKAAAAARAADVVIAGNWVLAEWAATEADDVRVIPSCVEPASYVPKATYEVHDPPIIGWLGSASTERFLVAISEPLRRLHAERGARMLLVGSGGGHLGALEEIIERRPWSLQSQACMAADCDIAVMPLDGSAYAAGKCGYKLLQYAAMGLPAVASPSGVNAEVSQALGQTSASSVDDWSGAMSELLDLSADRRAEVGRQARTAVSARYSFDAWQSCWTRAVLGS